MPNTDVAGAVRYRVTGMDCSACAAKIEAAARSIAGVREAKVSIASQEMTLWTVAGTTPLRDIERSITGLGYRLARIEQGEDDDKIPDLSHVTPAYKRAGELGENITTAGLDLERMPLGTLIELGPTAIIELTGFRTPCVLIDRFRPADQWNSRRRQSRSCRHPAGNMDRSGTGCRRRPPG